MRNKRSALSIHPRRSAPNRYSSVCGGPCELEEAVRRLSQSAQPRIARKFRNAYSQSSSIGAAAPDPARVQLERFSDNGPLTVAEISNDTGHHKALMLAGNRSWHLGSNAFPADPARLGLASGRGLRLPDRLRARMEAALGADFSGVRIHVGPQPQRLGAIAFAAGSDLYFAPGRYQPGTAAGRRLLGHELAHVVQQRQGRVRNPLGERLAVVNDRALEVEANRFGLFAATLWSRAVSKKRLPGSRPRVRDNFYTIQRTIWVRNSTNFLKLNYVFVLENLSVDQQKHFTSMWSEDWRIARLGTPGTHPPKDADEAAFDHLIEKNATKTLTDDDVEAYLNTPTTPTTTSKDTLYFNDLTGKSDPDLKNVTAGLADLAVVAGSFLEVKPKPPSKSTSGNPSIWPSEVNGYFNGLTDKDEDAVYLGKVILTRSLSGTGRPVIATHLLDTNAEEAGVSDADAALWSASAASASARAGTATALLNADMYIAELQDYERAGATYSSSAAPSNAAAKLEKKARLLEAKERLPKEKEKPLEEEWSQDYKAKVEARERLRVVWQKLLHPLMLYNGQLRYIWQQPWFQNQNCAVLVDVNYYGNRPYSQALGMHKDTQGQNLFVNLLFNNSSPLPGTEWTLDLEPVAGPKKDHMMKWMPNQVLADIESARKLINDNKEKVTGTRTIEGGVAQAFAFLSWVDELIWHCTPFVGPRRMLDNFTCLYHPGTYSEKPGVCEVYCCPDHPNSCYRPDKPTETTCPEGDWVGASSDFKLSASGTLIGTPAGKSVKRVCGKRYQKCGAQLSRFYYSCRNHPEVVEFTPQKCPKCFKSLRLNKSTTQAFLEVGAAISDDKGDKYGPIVTRELRSDLEPKGMIQEPTNVGNRGRANSKPSPALIKARENNPKRAFIRSWVRVVPLSEKLKTTRPDQIEFNSNG
jgi:hypothetical protein